MNTTRMMVVATLIAGSGLTALSFAVAGELDARNLSLLETAVR